jgi:hypothetical protein
MAENGNPWPIPGVAPLPPSPPPIDLFVPPLADRVASPEQRRKIALIQVEFAQAVSAQLTRSYGEVAEILRAPPVQEK